MHISREFSQEELYPLIPEDRTEFMLRKHLAIEERIIAAINHESIHDVLDHYVGGFESDQYDNIKSRIGGFHI